MLLVLSINMICYLLQASSDQAYQLSREQWL